MTQKEQLIQLFEQNGWRMKLGELLQHSCGYKCTSRFSDLRKMGYTITCTKGERPSDNVYEMKRPFVFDETGQGMFLEEK